MPAEGPKHTPGPWRECGADRGGCRCRQVWSVTGDVMVAIAVEFDEFHPVPPEIAHANARLIAASPALLAALEVAEDWLTNSLFDCTGRSQEQFESVVEQVQAAIKAAKGTG